MIKNIGLFSTPEHWDEIMEWINSHPARDRASLMTVAGMAWNLAVKAVEGVELVEDVEDA